MRHLINDPNKQFVKTDFNLGIVKNYNNQVHQFILRLILQQITRHQYTGRVLISSWRLLANQSIKLIIYPIVRSRWHVVVFTTFILTY